MQTFYMGVTTLSHAQAFPDVMISVDRLINRVRNDDNLRNPLGHSWYFNSPQNLEQSRTPLNEYEIICDIRQKPLQVNNWILDSGGHKDPKYANPYCFLDQNPRLHSPELPCFFHGFWGHQWRDNWIDWLTYSVIAKNLAKYGSLQAVISQDLMPQPGDILTDVANVNIELYQRIKKEIDPIYTIPVLHGLTPEEYAIHAQMYSPYLTKGAWVAVGGLLRFKNDLDLVAQILLQIKKVRPDFRLHGLGVKLKLLRLPIIEQLLYSADSAAWEFDARYKGKRKKAERLQHGREYLEKVQRNSQQGVIPGLFNFD